MKAIVRDELIQFVDDYLSVKTIRDASVNGLQVIGKENVKRVALGVSANLALFAEAAQWQADVVLVHHGLLWRDEPRRIDDLVKRRLKVLFDNDITLLAYHLPLDAHPEVGNNVQILRRLGLNLESRDLGLYDGTYLGAIGSTRSPLPLNDFVALVNKLFQTTSLVLPFGAQQVQRIGIVSGGAAGDVISAFEQRCDVYLTGEAKEGTPALCQELGMNYIAPGHYNTEKFGVMALGDLIRDRFEVETKFIDVPNSL